MIKKPKSLGVMRYPFFELALHSVRDGKVVLTLKDSDKKLKIEGSSYFIVRQLVKCARMIAVKEADGLANLLREAENLKNRVGTDLDW